MDTNQVTEHLQVIRTLMERSALYRRALAPIMMYCGIVGIAGGLGGWLFQINSDRGFVLFWSGVALIALSGAFLLVRRQALKDAEPFWSSPTKRVTQAILPPLSVGMFIGVIGMTTFTQTNDSVERTFLVITWTFLYGCALHSAGFVISRGFRLFAWIFILTGGVLLASDSILFRFEKSSSVSHILMGAVFGGLHLVYGIYLHFTEKRKSAL